MIREFDFSEYDEIMKLWQTAGLILRPGDERDAIKLKLERDPDLFLVAEEDRVIVGSVIGGWDGRRGWIYHLAVRSDRRRTGVGRALLAELERRLAKKGTPKINAQIYATNAGSIRFFRALGYEVHSNLIMVGKLLKK